ncbi:MarR family winged helix-turn-helix transcriptional regulator [Corticibacterium sp. UT-5YL-CI-8]|nr:MarR family winged helix-turn-helix transcriptional regulator [Tianweitania sp. UT-5YL-CI-8]
MKFHIDPDSFGFLVNDVARLSRLEMDRRIDEAGLGFTTGEGRTLIHIKRAGPVRQNVLAERLGVEAMTCSTTLDRLEAKGFIERKPDPTDRRAKLVVLTAAGEDVIERVGPIGATIREDAALGLTPAEWETFLGTLRHVRSTLTSIRERAQAHSREDAA